MSSNRDSQFPWHDPARDDAHDAHDAHGGRGIDGTHRVDATGGQSAVVDLGRAERCGLPEAIYGDGKPAELIIRIVAAQIAAGQTALVTRVADDAANRLVERFDHVCHHRIARTAIVSPRAIEPLEPSSPDVPHVAVITAGSTDAPVADEAIQTLHWSGTPHRTYDDIGVAGPQRLSERINSIRAASIVIVVAGMEGALPSVVAGHVAVPVIAVPTSVGYGANLSGITPLLSALASCAPGVMTVGIDAGYKAAHSATLIMRLTHRPPG